MNKNTVTHFNLFSLALVISYFFIHNIFFVLIGILLSIYLININRIEKLLVFIYNHFAKDLAKKSKNNDVQLDHKTNDINIDIQDSNLNLVYIIEESGFIPSTDKKKDMNAA